MEDHLFILITLGRLGYRQPETLPNRVGLLLLVNSMTNVLEHSEGLQNFTHPRTDAVVIMTAIDETDASPRRSGYLGKSGLGECEWQANYFLRSVLVDLQTSFSILILTFPAKLSGNQYSNTIIIQEIVCLVLFCIATGENTGEKNG